MKKLLEKIKNPSVAVKIVVFVLTAAVAALSLLLAFSAKPSTAVQIVAYFLYAAAAVLLAYSIYIVVQTINNRRKNPNGKAAQFLQAHPRLKVLVFTTFSFALSVYNAGYNAYFGIKNASYWYISLSVYYFLLILLRGMILLYQYFRKQRTLKTELTVFLVCGAALTAMTLALSGVILMMVTENVAFEKTGIMVYVAALFAFYQIVMSTVNLVKARKEDDYTIKALRRINLSAAAVAIFALQSTLNTAFSTEAIPWYYDAITGGVVCAFILGMGTVTIIQANKKLAALKAEGQNE